MRNRARAPHDPTIRGTLIYPGRDTVLEAIEVAAEERRLSDVRDLWRVDRAFIVQQQCPRPWRETTPEIRAAALHFEAVGRELWTDVPDQASFGRRRGSAVKRLAIGLGCVAILLTALGRWGSSSAEARDAELTKERLDNYEASVNAALEMLIQEGFRGLDELYPDPIYTDPTNGSERHGSEDHDER